MKKDTLNDYAIALYETTQNKSGADLSAIVKNFAELLFKKGLVKQTNAIINKFLAYSKKQAGIIDLEITSARALPETVVTEIEKAFGSKVLSTTKIDPSLMGGVTIKTSDKIFDASIKAQLNKLKQQLS